MPGGELVEHTDAHLRTDRVGLVEVATVSPWMAHLPLP